MEVTYKLDRSSLSTTTETLTIFEQQSLALTLFRPSGQNKLRLFSKVDCSNVPPHERK